MAQFTHCLLMFQALYESYSFPGTRLSS